MKPEEDTEHALSEIPSDEIHHARVSCEDIETILEGVLYVACAQCKANTEARRPVLNASCHICRGWGCVPNPRYAAAARRAGLPEPRTMEETQIAKIGEVLSRMRDSGVRVDSAELEALEALEKLFPEDT